MSELSYPDARSKIPANGKGILIAERTTAMVIPYTCQNRGYFWLPQAPKFIKEDVVVLINNQLFGCM